MRTYIFSICTALFISCSPKEHNAPLYVSDFFINYNDTTINIDNSWFISECQSDNNEICQIKNVDFINWLKNNDFPTGWSDNLLQDSIYSSKEDFLRETDEYNLVFYNLGKCYLSEGFDSYMILRSSSYSKDRVYFSDEDLFIFNIKKSRLLSIIQNNKYWCYVPYSDSGIKYTQQISENSYCIYTKTLSSDVIYVQEEDRLENEKPIKECTYSIDENGFLTNVFVFD